MKPSIKEMLASGVAKRVYLVLAIGLVFFVVCNDFLIPWYVNQGGILMVPSVVGMNFDDAVRVLDSLGLEARKGDVRMDREHPEGVVIIQNPVAGDRVKSGRRIYLTVSGGELLVTVPSVKGRTIREARFVLEREGLKLGAVEYQPSDSFPQNTVVEQGVAAGTKIKRDKYVSVVVSQGSLSQKVTIPDLSGKTLTEATNLLASIGLKPGNISYVPSMDLLPNTVVDQYPRGGELVPLGSAVDLIIIQGGEKKKELLEN